MLNKAAFIYEIYKVKKYIYFELLSQLNITIFYMNIL